MSMRYTVSSFVALFASLGLLLTGGGLLGTLLGVRMGIEGFPTPVIGLITACYSVGFVLATRVCGRIIARVGHIRTFAALGAVGATTTLAYPLVIAPMLWAAMRVFYGFSMAGLYMVVESWLNDRTPREYRGQIFGIYSIVTYLGLGGGQFALIFGNPGGFQLFSISSILIGLALVPVTVARTTSPEIIEVRPIRLRELHAASPLGLTAACVAGVINGSFLGMAPVYAQGVGFDSAGVGALMGLSIVGGFLLQWPIGRLSDLYNRRLVIASVALAVMLCSLAIVYATDVSRMAVIGLAILWGGLAFTLYPVAVSLTNDFVEPSQLLGASAGLLLVHGVGMIAGPVLSAQAMGIIGPGGLFWTLAVAAFVLMSYALFRQRIGPALVPEESSAYQVVPRNTPYASRLDPRSLDVQMEFDFGEDLAASPEGADRRDEEKTS